MRERVRIQIRDRMDTGVRVNHAYVAAVNARSTSQLAAPDSDSESDHEHASEQVSRHAQRSMRTRDPSVRSRYIHRMIPRIARYIA